MRVNTISLFVGWLIIGFVGVGQAFSQSANTSIAQETKESWTLLFNGTSTAEWTTSDGKPVPAGWIVENGILTARKGAKGTPSLAPINRLILTFNKLTGNSGLKYFYTHYTPGESLSMEYQILVDKLAEDKRRIS